MCKEPHLNQMAEVEGSNNLKKAARRDLSQQLHGSGSNEQTTQSNLSVEQAEARVGQYPQARSKNGYNRETAMDMETNTLGDQSGAITLPRRLQARIYTSHLLSTWNSRSFEFGAILFLAAIYPGTLRPMSIYALARGVAAILFAQPVGSWIDHGDRLTVVKTSIAGQRFAVAIGCGLFWVMEAGAVGGANIHGEGKASMDGLLLLWLFWLVLRRFVQW